MKLIFALAAIGGLALGSAANAQVSCSEINRINTESLDDFEGISGEEIDDENYKATYKLSGADDCSLNYEWDSIYSCGYQFSSYASASDARNSLAGAIGSCLPGWQSRTVPAEAAASDGWRTLTGTLYSGTGTYEDLEWASVLEEHTDTSGTHYHVWVELAYFW
jgi:hypothetical protein